MNILERIVVRKKEEVAERKLKVPVKKLEESPLFDQANISLKRFIKDPSKTGIIAEFKKKSPSKGMIHADADVIKIAKAYQDAGASAISVLTDIDFFGGSDRDLLSARMTVDIPILRKDFIIDEYQILEARSLGANIILLIAAVLSPEEVHSLSKFAHSLDMEVLLEVHDQEELFPNLYDSIDVIGVNNRNLKDFSVSIQTSLKLAELIPESYLKISESGISDPDNILILKRHGFDGFLIGENFMKTADPGSAMKGFVETLKLKEVITRKS